MAPSITHYRDRTDTKPDPVHRHDVRRWIFEENHGGAAWRVYMCLAFTYRRPLIPLLRRRLRGALRQRDLEGLCLLCRRAAGCRTPLAMNAAAGLHGESGETTETESIQTVSQQHTCARCADMDVVATQVRCQGLRERTRLHIDTTFIPRAAKCYILAPRRARLRPHTERHRELQKESDALVSSV